MSYKFFYLYFIGGAVALLLLIYQCVAYYPNLSTAGVIFNIIPVLLLFYLAYKVKREKQDQDLM
jgi:membrane protein implicated in regulation of membrane protease activity